MEWPEKFPFKDEDFARYDEYEPVNFYFSLKRWNFERDLGLFGRSPDTLFYSEPRFVTHIDDYAIAALTKYYSKVFPPSNTPGVCLLDMCSSWVINQSTLFLSNAFVYMSSSIVCAGQPLPAGIPPR